MIKIRLWALVAENVLKMVRPKRTAILPLRVTDAVPLANGDPTMATDRLPGAVIGLLKPRNYQRRFRLELAVRDVVIRQREVERILPRDERDWNVIPTGARLRIVRAPVVCRPVQVPRTLVVRDRIVSAGFLPYPEHRRDDVHSPRIPQYRRAGTGRDKDLRFHF